MEFTLDEALKKGIEAHKSGRVQEADRYYTAILKANPKHPDANHNMGALAVGIGKLQEALPFFKSALECSPNIAKFWLSYIDTLIKLDRIADARRVFDQAKSKGAKGDGFDQIERTLVGLGKGTRVNIADSKSQEPSEQQLQNLSNLYTHGQYQETLTQALKLLKKFPNSINLNNIIGATNQGLGKLDEAIEAFTKALSLKPDYADGYYNLGNALKNQRNLDEAIEAYKKAISIEPDYANAYNNLGTLLKQKGKFSQAIDAYQKAISIKPDYPYPYYNKGIIYQTQGKLGQAIQAYQNAISIDEDYPDALKNLGGILQDISFKEPNKGLQKVICLLLDKKTFVRPNNIMPAATSLLKLDPNLAKYLNKLGSFKNQHSLSEIIGNLTKLPLLLKLMSICPISDIEVEKLLKDLRAKLLFNISSIRTSTELIKFQTALALQCFTNEYIYTEGEDEKKAIKTLEMSVVSAIDMGKKPCSRSILCLASYKPISHYDWHQTINSDRHLKEVYKRQVLEPLEEAKLKPSISVAGRITDKVSSIVREQYEYRPYPRWVNPGLRLSPISISQVIEDTQLKIFDDTITDVEAPEILIAGCGTGQHPIGTASRFKSSKVLAVDLSLSSLAYAKRKTTEFSIGNIEYIQSDILDLEQLNKQFDIIESSGVLHHMDQPMLGWKILTNCLKPGGLMKIGLYSELARKHIVKIREEIAAMEIGTTKENIQFIRGNIIKSRKKHHKLIQSSADFYSMSALVDLLFHIKEHRFTIPQIKSCLDELGLKFCGFEAAIVTKFKKQNLNRDDMYNLDKWALYERANQRSFAGMYQFWCQKVD